MIVEGFGLLMVVVVSYDLLYIRLLCWEVLDCNLVMELVWVIEVGVMVVGCWVGCGDKEGGDGVVVDVMCELVNLVFMCGVVVIGEGEKDYVLMFYNGEEVGNGDGLECDFVVDFIDGIMLMSKGMINVILVLVVVDCGIMFDLLVVFYMNKIVVGFDVVYVLDIIVLILENI